MSLLRCYCIIITPNVKRENSTILLLCNSNSLNIRGFLLEVKMNVKELANVAGVSTETIRRSAKVLFPSYMRKGV